MQPFRKLLVYLINFVLKAKQAIHILISCLLNHSICYKLAYIVFFLIKMMTALREEDKAKVYHESSCSCTLIKTTKLQLRVEQLGSYQYSESTCNVPILSQFQSYIYIEEPTLATPKFFKSGCFFLFGSYIWKSCLSSLILQIFNVRYLYHETIDQLSKATINYPFLHHRSVMLYVVPPVSPYPIPTKINVMISVTEMGLLAK